MVLGHHGTVNGNDIFLLTNTGWKFECFREWKLQQLEEEVYSFLNSLSIERAGEEKARTKNEK